MNERNNISFFLKGFELRSVSRGWVLCRGTKPEKIFLQWQSWFLLLFLLSFISGVILNQVPHVGASLLSVYAVKAEKMA